jgi:hypothetical protein
MRLSNSSIFSFERSRLPMLGRAKFRRRFLIILLWTVGVLVLLDVGVGSAFRLPRDPGLLPTTFQAYFNYGRSMEGKLRQLLGATPGQDALIVNAGWLSRECDRQMSVPPDKLGIEIYGMSFSNRIADQLASQDRGLAIQHFGGPAAPLSHSYACFVQRDESGLERAPVQIIGVLGGSVRRVLTISGLTTSFEQPMPFTYPRFTLNENGHLVAHWSSIESPDDLHAALADRNKWNAFLQELATWDAFYAPELFSANVADYSVLLRMTRRAWAQHLLRDRTAALGINTAFDGASEVAAIMRAMLTDFAVRARTRGRRPIVLLFEDRGYGGVLSGMLAATLRANGVDFLTSASFAPTDDPSKFLPDGHFTSAVDAEMAGAVLRLIGRK